MKTNLRKALVALALAGASIGVGVTLAGAQTDTTTPTNPPTTVAPQNPSNPDQPDADAKENCPKDGTGRARPNRDGSGTEGTSLRTTQIRLT